MKHLTTVILIVLAIMIGSSIYHPLVMKEQIVYKAKSKDIKMDKSSEQKYYNQDLSAKTKTTDNKNKITTDVETIWNIIDKIVGSITGFIGIYNFIKRKKLKE